MVDLQDSIIYSNYKLPTTKPYNLELKIKDFHYEWSKCKVTSFNRCIDIGAHVGVYAYQYSKLFKYVECFEPIPTLFDMLEKNTWQIDNIKRHNVAISNLNSNVMIYENPIRTESNVVVSKETKELLDSRWTGKNSKWKDQEPISVPCKKVDSYNFDKVDFIKIDTEGYITPVLEGLKNTLINNSPVIQMEAPKERTSENSFLNSLGYRRYDRLGEDVYYMR